MMFGNADIMPRAGAIGAHPRAGTLVRATAKAKAWYAAAIT